MANKKITELDSLGTAPATNDVIPMVDTDAGVTKKVTVENLSGGLTGLTTSQLAAASVVTESDTIASNDNDTTLPTSAAVKDYVDAQILTKDNLDEIAEGTTNKHFTASDETKLDGIETGATADQTDAEIRTAVEAATDSNVFTDADHSKLDGIESGADVTDATNVAAAGALMDSELTDLAGVKGVTISTLQVKPSEGAFVDGDKTKLDGIESGATADQTGAQIKSLYEGESDTNAFTDADHSKLDGIEASATADQTDAEIRAAVDAATDSNVFTDADHSKLDGIASSANNYSHPNHSGEVVSTGDGATVVSDDVIDEANLKVDNSPTNDYVLTAKSSAAGGLTWAEVSIEASAINDLSDVTITSPANTEVLTYNGSAWVNSAASGGGGGSGTVNTGADGCLAYYDGAGTAVNDASTLVWDDVNSRLGVGTVSPKMPLQLSSYGGLDGNSNELIIRNNTYYDSGLKRIGAGYATEIQLQDSDGSIRFMTATTDSADSAVTLNERLTILEGGNIGLGTAVPSTSLHVSGAFSSGSTPYIRSEDTTSTGALIEMYATQASSAGYVQTGASTDIRFAPAGSTKMLLEHTTGSLGLGTTSPSQKLQITGPNDTDHLSILLNSSSDSSKAIYAVEGNTAGTLCTGTVARAAVMASTASGTALQLGTAGVIRATFDSSGNCGLGTTAPSEKLSVSSGNILIDNSQAYRSKNTSGITRSLLTLFSDNNLYVQSPSDIIFQTNQDASTVSAMTIDSSGNCGLGTAAPSSKLEISGSGTLAKFTGTGTNTYLKITDGTSSGGNFIGATGDSLHFWADNEKVVTIKEASGNPLVGIGTDAPSYPLSVVSGTANYAALGDASSTNGAAALHLLPASNKTSWSIGANYNVSDGFNITPSTATGGETFSTPALSISSSSNVGIGTTAPSSKMHIVGGNGNQLKLDNGGEQWTQLSFANSGTSKTFLGLDHTNHNFILGAQGDYSSFDRISFRPDGSNDDMVIKSDGKVGLGTTAPTQTLHVEGEAYFSTASGGELLIDNSGASGILIQQQNGGSTTSGSLNISSGTATILTVNDSEVFRINSSGAWSFDGGSSFGLSGFDYLFSDGNGSTPYWDDGFGESDSRLKENVKEFKALDSINKLRPVEFDWNNKAKKEGHDFGLIAQEVEPVLPNIVRECKRTGYKKLDYEGMVPFLVQSVKELTEENKALRERLDAIEQKVQSL